MLVFVCILQEIIFIFTYIINTRKACGGSCSNAVIKPDITGCKIFLHPVFVVFTSKEVHNVANSCK